MWVLPSRSRPHNVARFVQAYQATGATTPVWLRLDDDDPLKDVYDIPESWHVCLGPRWPLADVYNDFFDWYSDLGWYGFIADDVVPETMEWDRKLIEIAGRDGMAVPAGGHDPNGAPHFVLGGDLVREIGWLALPGLDRLYIDTAWQDIAKARGVQRRIPEVILAHYHFSNRKSLYDAIYRKLRRHEDRAIYEKWRATM